MKFVMIDGIFINLDHVTYVRDTEDGCVLCFNLERKLVVKAGFNDVVALINGAGRDVESVGSDELLSDDRKLRQALDYTEMSVRLANVCAANHWEYVGDLALLTRRELIKYPQFGNVCFNEMVDYLKWNHGLEYNDKVFKYDAYEYVEWRKTV